MHHHDHHGHHAHHHHDAPADPSRAFAFGVGLNLLFVVVELTFGYIAGSVALVADAAHNLGDTLGLGLAWAANALARRAPTPRRTYGYRKSTVLAALANAVLIYVAVGGVAWEAIERIGAPPAVDSGLVMLVAGVGVVINGVSALLFARGREGDANLRGAFLHLVADAAVSVGVVLAGLAMYVTDSAWIDPVVSLAIAGVLVVSAWGLLRDALAMAMDAVPAHIDPERVRAFLEGQASITAVHDLHIWPMSTTEVAMTAHLEVADGHDPRLCPALCEALRERFAIDHATVQLESSEAAGDCRQAHHGAL